MALRLKVNPDVLQYIDRVVGPYSKTKAAIILDLKDFALDPEPGNFNWRSTSTRVEFLSKTGFNVRRLTLKTTWPAYRFFYLYDEKHEFVYIMEVTTRDAKTYANEPHIRRVKLKYTAYFKEELWRN
jgi:hypothetical protein